ncbi:Ig-like domain-containing protein [Tomitella fengzijianii]|nr:Ig-like domain-containing protein [Tomitella fengzijianii]
MSRTTTRRIAAGVSAGALAASLATTIGVGAAGAETSSVSWGDGSSNFQRTVSDATPSVGDTITTTTTFTRDGIVDEYLYRVKDLHPECFAYVPGSAQVGGSAIDDVETGSSFTAVNGGSFEWPVRPVLGPKSRTFSFSYTVGTDCRAGSDFMTSMHYDGSLGAGTYQDEGPTVTVEFAASQTQVQPVYGAKAGQPVTIAAKVAGGTVPQNGGDVQFKADGVDIGAPVAVDPATGIAQTGWTPADAGNTSLTAVFLGNLNTDGSTSDPRTVSVAQQTVDSKTSLSVASGAQVGSATSVTATVAPPGAGGTVTFKDNEVDFATVPVTDGDGGVSVDWIPGSEGSHTIKAVFSGRDGVNGSGAQQTVTVAPKPAESVTSTTTLDPVAPFDLGGTATLKATVTSEGATDGTVTFRDGDEILGTVDVVNGVATLEDWKPTIGGDHAISAEFSGIGDTLASNAAITVTVDTPETPGPGDPGDGGATGGSFDLSTLFGSLGSLGG